MKTPSEVVASIKSKNDGTAPKKAANQKSATPKTTGQKAWVPSEMIFKPLSQSVVMILISVTTKKIMDAKKLKALAAYLINSNIYKVIVLVGGTLRRYNFWDSKDYQAKLKSNTTTAFTPPTPQELESEAQGWEVKWQKENADTLEFLKNKLKKGHFQLLPWKEFLKKKNYRGIRNILNTKYQGMEEDLTSTQPSYASTVNTAANIYLKDLIDDKRVLPKHELQAHANIVEYILEEGPVLAPNILEPEIPRVDYLIYPEPMPAAIKASADALVNYTRLIVPEFRVTREEPPEIIGYSGSVEKFVSSLAKQSPTLSSSPSPSPTFDMEESNPASHFPSASGAAPIYFDALTEKDSDHKTTSSKELKEKTQYTSQYTGTTATASKTAKSVNSVYAISDAMKKICEMQNHLPPSASEAAPIQQHRSASIQPRPTFPMNSTSAPMATHQSSLTPKQLSHSDRQMNKHSLFNQNQAFPNPLLFNESDFVDSFEYYSDNFAVTQANSGFSLPPFPSLTDHPSITAPAAPNAKSSCRPPTLTSYSTIDFDAPFSNTDFIAHPAITPTTASPSTAASSPALSSYFPSPAASAHVSATTTPTTVKAAGGVSPSTAAASKVAIESSTTAANFNNNFNTIFYHPNNPLQVRKMALQSRPASKQSSKASTPTMASTSHVNVPNPNAINLNYFNS